MFIKLLYFESIVTVIVYTLNHTKIALMHIKCTN